MNTITAKELAKELGIELWQLWEFDLTLDRPVDGDREFTEEDADFIRKAWNSYETID